MINLELRSALLTSKRAVFVSTLSLVFLYFFSGNSAAQVIPDRDWFRDESDYEQALDEYYRQQQQGQPTYSQPQSGQGLCPHPFSGTEYDRYMRIACNAVEKNDLNTAIINFKRALNNRPGDYRASQALFLVDMFHESGEERAAREQHETKMTQVVSQFCAMPINQLASYANNPSNPHSNLAAEVYYRRRYPQLGSCEGAVSSSSARPGGENIPNLSPPIEQPNPFPYRLY